jgi:hypothetical protein
MAGDEKVERILGLVVVLLHLAWVGVGYEKHDK